MSDVTQEAQAVAEIEDATGGPTDVAASEEVRPEAPAIPVRPPDFWHAGDGVSALDNPTPFGQENALQKLGRPPFEKSARSKFRLLGYLATVYEHVAKDVGAEVEAGK